MQPDPSSANGISAAEKPAEAPTQKAPSPAYRPEWVALPTPSDINHAFPRLAANIHKDGKVVETCKIRPDGLLGECAISWESPAGYGFGAAALSLTPKFRVTRPSQDRPPEIAPDLGDPQFGKVGPDAEKVGEVGYGDGRHVAGPLEH
jgi:hypothetical protein